MNLASYPHIHSHGACQTYGGRYAPPMDMTGCGQMLRTCPQPLDNSTPAREDISTVGNQRTFLLWIDIERERS